MVTSPHPLESTEWTKATSFFSKDKQIAESDVSSSEFASNPCSALRNNETKSSSSGVDEYLKLFLSCGSDEMESAPAALPDSKLAVLCFSCFSFFSFFKSLRYSDSLEYVVSLKE